MVTLPDMTFTSDLSLTSMLNVLTKAEILKICQKLDLYVSPNLKKLETAKRTADEMMDCPEAIYYRISKTEFPLLAELVEAGKDTYVVRRIRKTPYMLQKLCLVTTYIDEEKGEWHILMPDRVREALAADLPVYKQLHEKGVPFPSPDALRMRAALNNFLGM